MIHPYFGSKSWQRLYRIGSQSKKPVDYIDISP